MKMRILIAMCLVLTLLCACTGEETIQTNPNIIYNEEPIYAEQYTIYNEDGTWYMEFSPEETAADTNPVEKDSVLIAKSYPRFDSIQDMQQQIITGTLSDSDIALLRADSKDNKLEICNPYDLHDLTLPDGLTCSSVSWSGDAYKFSLSGTAVSGYVTCCDKESYDYHFETMYASFPSEDTSVISEVILADRNAREVHYMTDSSECKKVIYELHTGEYDFYATELFVLNRFNDASQRTETSSTIPENVRLYWNDGEQYYYGYIYGFSERPTEQWITSFQLVPTGQGDGSKPMRK